MEVLLDEDNVCQVDAAAAAVVFLILMIIICYKLHLCRYAYVGV